MDKKIEWSKEKSEWLRNKYDRKGIRFEECKKLIQARQVLDDIDNPNYPHQRMFILEVRNYVYLVPYVEDDDKIFLKTVYPSKKYTEIYLDKEKQ